MNGLLDDPAQAGLLSMGLRLLSTPGKFGQAFGQAGLGAMGDIQQAKAAQQAKKARALQEQMLQMQLEQIKAQQAQQRGVRDAAKASFTPGNMLPPDMAGPTTEPSFDARGFAGKLAEMGDPSMLMQMMQAPKRKLTAYKPGDQVRDEDGNIAFEVPSQDKEPEALRALAAVYGKDSPEYMQAARQYAQKLTTHQPGVSVSYGAPVAGEDAAGKPVFFQPSRGGGAPAIIPGVAPANTDKPLTEGQAKAVAFASRAQSADMTLAKLARKGVRTTIPGAMGNNTVGSVITAASNPEQQQLGQAKRDFINAVLRRESGAVIAADEFANADRQYFPQIGDSREVIEQKAQNRRIAIEGMKADVPTAKRGEVDRISGAASSVPADDNDPLGLRK